ncbi:hypothetical protein Tco_1540971 [Tanacetum coccineum]
MDDGGITSCEQANSRDGITIAKIRNVEGKVGSDPSIDHTSMEDVVSVSVGLSSDLDGIADYKGGDFEFGRNDKSKGILKKPAGPFFKVHFRDNSVCNPFGAKTMNSNGNAWNARGINGFGSTILSNQFSANVDRFAEKLKQGTSMDYKVVRGNLMRMWRVYSIEEITKTSYGIFYFKFKSEEGMKYVLDSGPWMVQNVPLVLNLWEPGKPVLIDKMTKERCLKKAGRLDYARVLVEVSANEELPNVLEIEYPPLGNRPAKVRPRTLEEAAAKDSFMGNNVDDSSMNKSKANNMDKDVFVTVGKNNKLAIPSVKYDSGLQYEGYQSGWSNKSNNGVNQFKYQPRVVNIANASNKNVQGGGSLGNISRPFNKASSNSLKKETKPASQTKSLQQISKNPNYKPKVLVRGSNSKDSPGIISMEPIPISNSFQVLVDEDVVQCSKGSDMNLEDELDWTIHQMDYFYKNYHKFHLDPSYEDDDVETEVDGIASEMKPEYDIDVAIAKGNGAAPSSNVIELLREDIYSLCGLLETHVKKEKLAGICRKVMGNWEWVSNSSCCFGGTRIIIGWNPNHINLMAMDQTDQVIHYFVESLDGKMRFHCSFIYTHIHTVDRRSLWKSLHSYSKAVKDAHWVILGDFNATLDPSEKSTSVEDIAMSGFNFTWNKRPGKVGGLLKKLDRVMGNSAFMSFFPSSHVVFLPFMTSDHTHTIKSVWDGEIDGYAMFSLVSKLRLLKKPLRKLNFEQGNLFENVKLLRKELSSIQAALVEDPHSSVLSEKEVKCLKAYRAALKDEESLLKQKSKSVWHKEGDMNSKYFHNVVKGRLNRGRISVVEDISSYVKPLEDPESLFHNKLYSVDALFMIRDVSDDEIKNAAWSIVGGDLCKAVKEFFKSSKLLKEVNSTIISLVPKPQTPRLVSDYRPIACCNVVYKIISKIILGRIKYCLGDLVNQNQCAFIPDRLISDNILLSQELMRGYHINRGVAKCAFKVDIQKAYDSVEWKFLKSCLVNFGFHKVMINWIMKCVSSTSFSINVNGDLQGFFKGSRGLRQGDPLSPYLFTLVIEVLNLLIKRQISLNKDFKYHCKSVTVLKKAIDEFREVSGLLPSIPKSTVFLILYGLVRFINTSLKVGASRIFLTSAGGCAFWSWRKILKVRWMVRDHIVHRIGIYSGLSLNTKVAEMIDKGCWLWPKYLSDKFDGLLAIVPHQLDCEKADTILWRNNVGEHKKFYVSTIWNDIGENNMVVPWAKLVWFSQCNPRHSFMGNASSLEDICTLFKESVRLKVIGLRLKDSFQVSEVAKLWEFHVKRGQNIGIKKVDAMKNAGGDCFAFGWNAFSTDEVEVECGCHLEVMVKFEHEAH